MPCGQCCYANTMLLQSFKAINNVLGPVSVSAVLSKQDDALIFWCLTVSHDLWRDTFWQADPSWEVDAINSVVILISMVWQPSFLQNSSSHVSYIEELDVLVS